MVDYIYRLVYVEPVLHPRDEAYLIMMDKLFDVLLQSVASILLKILHGYGPEVFFFCCVSAGFWYQDNVGLIKGFGKGSLFLHCLE